jgi:hypothetical protein
MTWLQSLKLRCVSTCVFSISFLRTNHQWGKSALHLSSSLFHHSFYTYFWGPGVPTPRYAILMSPVSSTLRYMHRPSHLPRSDYSNTLPTVRVIWLKNHTALYWTANKFPAFVAASEYGCLSKVTCASPSSVILMVTYADNRWRY